MERYNFSLRVLEGVEIYHDDIIVITTNISDANVRRILVDIGSSCDILFISAFNQIGIDEKELNKLVGPLTGFNNIETLDMINVSPHIIQRTPKASDPEGQIYGYGYQVGIWCKSLIRPSLNTLSTIISTLY